MASSQPATSVNVVLGMSLEISFALDLPNCMTPRPPPPCMLFSSNRNTRKITTNGSTENRKDPIRLGLAILEFDSSMVPLATCWLTSLMIPCCWPATQYAVTLSPALRAPLSRVAWICWSPPTKVISLT